VQNLNGKPLGSGIFHDRELIFRVLKYLSLKRCEGLELLYSVLGRSRQRHVPTDLSPDILLSRQNTYIAGDLHCSRVIWRSCSRSDSCGYAYGLFCCIPTGASLEFECSAFLRSVFSVIEPNGKAFAIPLTRWLRLGIVWLEWPWTVPSRVGKLMYGVFFVSPDCGRRSRPLTRSRRSKVASWLFKRTHCILWDR